jgi:alpha 1,2-mannosyltransferase
MNAIIRYILLGLGIIVGFLTHHLNCWAWYTLQIISILTLTYHEYSWVTPASRGSSKFRTGSSPIVSSQSPLNLQASSSIEYNTSTISAQSEPKLTDEDNKRANATMLMLARNSDLEFAYHSIREIEEQFNRKHGYPWVLLNEVPFTEEFIVFVQSPLYYVSL